MTMYALTFVDDKGRKNTIYTDKVKPGVTDQMLAGFCSGIEELDVIKPDGSKPFAKLAKFEQVTEEQLQKRRRKPRKAKEPTAETAETDVPEPAEKIAGAADPLSNWHLSLKEIINLKPASVVRRLKYLHENGGDPTVFVTNLLLVKYVWHSGIFVLDQRIDKKDFYHEMREIYTPSNTWSQQMIEALPELSFIFGKEEWSRLHRVWLKRRDALKKVLKQVVADETIEEAAVTETIEGNLVLEAVDEKPPLKLTKAQKRAKRIVENKQKPKKKRGFFR